MRNPLFDSRAVRLAAQAALLLAIALSARVLLTNAHDSSRDFVSDNRRLVEELRLDAELHDFPRVTRVYVGPDGRIIVPIHDDKQVRVYSALGDEVARVGRSGSGPGEFSWVLDIGFRGDSFWINDIIQRRVAFVGPDGRFLRSVLYEDLLAGSASGDAAIANAIDRRFVFPLSIPADGELIGHTSLRSESPASSAAPVLGALVRFSRGAVPRVVSVIPRESAERQTVRVGGAALSVPFVHRAHFVASASGDRLALVEVTGQFEGERRIRVTVFLVTGETIPVREVAYEGELIPAGAKDSAIATIQLSREGPLEALAAAAKAGLPRFYSPIEWVVFGLDETIWIGLRSGVEGQPVIVLDESGVPLDTVLVPPGLRVRQADRTHLWVIQTDRDGLGSVVRLRLDPPIPQGPP